jgi:hypothetical protein
MSEKCSSTNETLFKDASLGSIQLKGLIVLRALVTEQMGIVPAKKIK